MPTLALLAEVETTGLLGEEALLKILPMGALPAVFQHFACERDIDLWNKKYQMFEIK